MVKGKKVVALVLAGACVSVAFAGGCKKDEVAAKSPWDGSNASFGFTWNTGNTNNKTINGSFNLIFKKDRWSNTANLGVQWQASNGVTSKDKYTLVNQTNYSFNKSLSSFVFGNLNYTMDHFSAYNYVVVAAAGYGRNIIKTPTFLFSAQAGPGLRHNKVREDGNINNNFVVTTQANMTWNITKAGTITETARYDWGQPYDYFQTVTAFTNKIIGNLAMQLSFELDYYSSIPPMSSNTKKTDTTTALSLVYNF